MSQLTPSDNRLEPLFTACKNVSELLAGSLTANANQDVAPPLRVTGQPQDIDSISYLYDSLMLAQPDAGQAYWITRSWNLLCWQPLSIAIIAVYQCHQAPSFSGFTQQIRAHSVSGFTLSANDIETGSIASLIATVGQRIGVLFEHYQQCLNEVVRCRPNFSKRLLADNLMLQFVRLQTLFPQFTSPILFEHAQWWFAALGLPNRLIDSLSVQEDSTLKLQRTSCCLAYKTSTGTLCDNCPKSHSKHRQK
jgi:siderophore ferric iron reductase